MAVVIETTVGDFTVDLYTDERPQTCRNFLKLCKMKYYNWNLFHTVQSNFIAQTGDPTGTGGGGESVYGLVLGEGARYYEAEQMPKIKHDKSGLLSMVNCGNNMLGSQFFVTLAPNLQSLDGEHCVFGEIAEGLDIILKFNETICDGEHRPYQDIRISHTVILEDPFEDPEGLVIPDRSPAPTKEALVSDRIGADEIIDDTAGMSTEEIIEMQKNKEAKARATILEIVGDIPDADMAPPENVLFVCKLNPVTTDDDLEIIFSRFGKIMGCEVIRDRQTGDSLQYAFIEFGERKSCEEAYFKMDNVLIDDRRIHVDFSQSVAKMRWRGKGKGIKYFDEKGDELENKEIHETMQRYRKSHDDKRTVGDVKFRNGGREEHRKFERRKRTTDRSEKEHCRNERWHIDDRERQREMKNRDRYKESYRDRSRRDKDRTGKRENSAGRHEARYRDQNRGDGKAERDVDRLKGGSRFSIREDSRESIKRRARDQDRYRDTREKRRGKKKEKRKDSSSSSASEADSSSTSEGTGSSSSSESEHEHSKKKREKSRENRHSITSHKHKRKRKKST